MLLCSCRPLGKNCNFEAQRGWVPTICDLTTVFLSSAQYSCKSVANMQNEKLLLGVRASREEAEKVAGIVHGFSSCCWHRTECVSCQQGLRSEWAAQNSAMELCTCSAVQGSCSTSLYTSTLQQKTWKSLLLEKDSFSQTCCFMHQRQRLHTGI